MSNLYIRLKTGFFSHVKTLRLHARIGDDAFWIPPRLWAYAAENKPDGDFSAFSSEELASLLGCYKYATSIQQALLDVGFLEKDGRIHGWQEHNNYHAVFSERAKTAAAARWADKKGKNQKKEISEKDKEKEKEKEKETSNASSILSANATDVVPLEKSKTKKNGQPDFPKELDTPEFKEAWERRLEHRRQSRKPMTALAQEQQLKNCAKWGIQKSIEAIDTAIANDWQGLFEPKENSGNGNSKPKRRQMTEEEMADQALRDSQ